MSHTKFDNILRSALWTSYNYICFYCNRPLDWDDLNIDHIIPELYSNDHVGFDKIKFEYGLDSFFDLNAHYNLVPSHIKCNLRKGAELFEKSTVLFYLNVTNKSVSKIEIEIEKLKNRRNKGQIIAKLQSALATNLIGINELEVLLTNFKEENWKKMEIKLPMGVEFLEEVYDLFYLNTDCSVLLDKKLLLGKTFDNLELENDKKEKRVVATLKEWRLATKDHFYPSTTFAIKMSSYFTFLDEFLKALHNARMPKFSFISEPWLTLHDLNALSPNILHDFEGNLTKYADKGFSVGDLVGQGIIKKSHREPFNIILEFEGAETSLSEQFRADFNNDGIEDIFVRGWTRAIGGTLGYGFTSVLTKYSNNHLIEEIR